MATDQTTRLEAATVKAENGSQIVYDFANGPATATVQTASGPIPTLAGKLDEISDTLAISSGIYPTTAAGLAATNSGQVFLVYASDDDDIIYRVYQNQNGTAFDTGKNTISGTDLEQALAQASQAATTAQQAADSVSASSQKLAQLGTSTGSELIGYQLTTLAAILKDLYTVRQTGATGLGSQDATAFIQSRLDAAPVRSGGAVIVYLPAGDWKVTAALVTNGKPVIIKGEGPYATRILCSYAGDLFQHGLTQVTSGAHFEIHDAGLYCTVAGAGAAINIRQDYNTGRFFLHNVFIGSFSSNFNWGNFMITEGTTRTSFRDVRCDGGSYNDVSLLPAATQVGCLFRSDNNTEKAFVFNFDTCDISAVVNAVRVEVNGAPGDSGTIEGMIFENCGGRTVSGPWFKLAVPNSATIWHPPYFVFDRCNMEGPGTLIDIESCSEFHMTKSLNYVQARSSSSPAVSDFVKLAQVRRVFIHDNTFQLYGGAVINNFIAVDANSQSVTITDNNFVCPSSGTVTLTGGVMIPDGVLDYHVDKNRYLNWPAGIPKEWNGAGGLLQPRLTAHGASAAMLRSNGSGAFSAINDQTGNTSYLTAKGGTDNVIFGLSASLANVSINYDALGAGSHTFRSNGGKNILSMIAGGSAVNYVQLASSNASFGPKFTAVGTDTNIPFRMAGKGSGAVAMESGTSIMAQTKAQVLALSASAYNGQTFRLTDVSQRFATSDGSVWRYQDGTQVT